MRLTKYEPTDESMFPYKLKDEELSTELDSVHKLGKLEDILEKHNVSSLVDLDNRLVALEIIKEKTLNINDLYWLKNGNYKKYRKNLELLYSRVEDEHLQKILKTKEEFDLLKEALK